MRCRIRARRPGRRPTKPSLIQALVLGVLHGPAELLPISSSAHVAAIPWLLGWSYARLEDELRKSFEVALHAGATAAWLISPATGRAELTALLRPPARPGAKFFLLTATPPAVAGLILERPIERRLGTPPTIAGGLIGGSLAMGLADRSSQERGAEEARGVDALWLGLAQAAALIPGVSRSGATLAAARARHFSRAASRRLSDRAAIPVIVGATGLRLVRTLKRSPDERAWLAAGAASSFISTIMLAPRLTRAQEGRSLLPLAGYRLALAGTILVRLRRADAASRGSRAARRRRIRP
ncbi:MAG TPA: undecaprenyl-diphosphate phosphatase [Solirubrobacteraceae bacterium]|nr:undecaprenyl-diphosphate phosphatase [Solirubrobacteraceae bacterium]